MPYAPLTEEQFQKAQDAGFSPDQIIQMEDRRKKVINLVEPTEDPEERGFFENLLKRPVERVLLEPLRRTTEALIASLPVVPREIRDKALDASRKDLIIDFPIFGEFQTRGLQLGQEGAQQLAGETLETIAWLYLPKVPLGAFGRGAAEPTLRTGIGAGARFGARAGAVGGGLFGAGEALQEGGGVGETIAGTGVGAAVGCVAGSVLGGALPVTPLVAKTGFDLSRSFVRSIAKVGTKVSGIAAAPIRGVTETVGRIITRGATDIAKGIERKEAIKKAPKHVGEAMKQGLEDTLISFLRLGAKVDKRQRAEMLNTAKNAVDDLAFMDQAKRLPGNTIVEGPAKFLVETARKGTEKTKQVLGSLPKQTVDVVGLFNQFSRDVRKIGLNIQNGKIVRLRGSRVPDADLPFYQQILSELRPNRLGKVPLTYSQMDALRDRWFQSVKKDQTFTEGVRGKTGYLGRIRALLTEKIDETARGGYREAQQQTAEALQGLREFVRLMGYRGDLEKITERDLGAGETFLRVFGNAADRPGGILQTLYGIAKKYGYKGEENVINQLRFADILESIYGQPSRNIGAQIARSISPSQDPAQVTSSAIREMVKWSPYSGTIRFLKARGFLGKSEEEVLRAFENLIRVEGGLSPTTRALLPFEESTKKIGEQARQEARKVFGERVEVPIQKVEEKLQRGVQGVKRIFGR